MKTAALYLRSSKDRSDVSIDSQRRELQKLAQEKSLTIVREYSDVVESAKDENRPGFQSLLRDLKNESRGWDHLLLVDTSRLSRRRYMAQVFKHEASKRGIKIIYSKIPETDPIADMVVIGVMEVFDELHSLMSKEKGLAGMAENVRQGFRAGGRAPKGYRLSKIETGAIREGEHVTKSRLEPNQDAPLIKRYLKQRAKGVGRKSICKSLGITWPHSTLIGMEWNAITYAGHTAWGVHNEFHNGHGYEGGKKRKPRDKWLIQKNTHDPLITDSESERIIELLSASRHGKRYQGDHHLLTGFLKTPDGKPWHTNGGKHYRIRASGSKGRYVDALSVESSVWKQIVKDTDSDEFIHKLTIETRTRRAKDIRDPTIEVRKQVDELNRQISKVMDLATSLEDPAPSVRKINELEASRKLLLSEIQMLEREHMASIALSTITEDQVRGILRGIIGEAAETDVASRRGILTALVDKVILDPSNLDCRIHYRIAVDTGISTYTLGDAINFLPILRAETILKIA